MTDIIAEALDLEPRHVDMCSAEFLFAPLTDTFTAEDRCNLALEHCEAESIFNFYKMYFCTMQTNNWLFYPIGVSIADSQPNLASVAVSDPGTGLLRSEFHS